LNCIEPININHYDLTKNKLSNWHVTTSGYNNYFWCGQEITGKYKNNWDDALYIAPNGEKSMDWSLSEESVTICFDSYQDFEGYPFDYGVIEVNPHVSQNNSYWYTFSYVFNEHKKFWEAYEIEVFPSMFYSSILDDNLYNIEGGFTGDMGLRFRFISNNDLEYTGWVLDNIEIFCDNFCLYDLNYCNDLDNVIAEYVYTRDFWLENSVFNGWSCKDEINNYLKNNLNNSLELSLPKAIFNELTFYHYYDLEKYGDYCILEISTNDSNSWISLLKFTGSNAGIIKINLSSFIGENVIIRWRIKTNSSGFSRFYTVGDICIYGAIDSEPPTTSAILGGSKERGWFHTSVTFKATAFDGVSGVANTYIRINNGSKLKYYGPVIIDTDGEHTIEYWSVDILGNEEEHNIMKSIKIDTTPPDVSLKRIDPGFYLFGKKFFNSYNIFIIGGFSFEALVEDINSDIFNVRFYVDDLEFFKTNKKPYIAYCSVRNLGYTSIKVIAEDNAGNINKDEFSLYYNKFF
jgi:hypothetical protein